MDGATIARIVDRLDGLEWCLFSGAAVAAYTDGTRELGDLDIALHDGDLYTFADRLGTAVEQRSFEKNGLAMEDNGFTTWVDGVEIEATNGFPPVRVETGSFAKVFENSTVTSLFGQDVPVAPVEEVLILKAYLFRDKDRRDLQLLSDTAFDRDLLLELLTDWQLDAEPIRSRLHTCGVDV